ncbi:IS30 family transposase [Micromonospora carbonacea]|uniref:IS30 family transposase n=1 Tax=Micromonospora carbonacea TaxID=47853 RepID=UPI0037229C01
MSCAPSYARAGPSARTRRTRSRASGAPRSPEHGPSKNGLPQPDARTELGHLEGDLIIGAKNSQVATLVDRTSRYLTMVALPSRHTATVIPALQQAFSLMDPRHLSTLTWDRGMELAGHRLLTDATGVDVFFAAPRSPWQRGTNENTNKLIRQYLPKGTDLSLHTQADLDALAARLNNRPRK